MSDEEYIERLSFKIYERLKDKLNLTDDELDKSLDEGRIYFTDAGYSHKKNVLESKIIYTNKKVETQQDGKYTEVRCPLLESLGVKVFPFHFVRIKDLPRPKVVRIDRHEIRKTVKNRLKDIAINVDRKDKESEEK